MNQKIKWTRHQKCRTVPALLSLTAMLGLSACSLSSQTAMGEQASTETEKNSEAALPFTWDSSALPSLKNSEPKIGFVLTENASEKETETETEAETEVESETEAEASGGKNIFIPVKLNPVPSSVILRTLKDYRELLALPLPPLPTTIQTLEARLTKMTESYSGQWSVYIKNLTTGDTFIINDTPMKSASVMKLFIMGTVYEALENGDLERSQEVKDLLNNMISYSSNSDSNHLLLLLGDGDLAAGIQKVNRYISSHNYGDGTHEFNGFNDTSTILDAQHSNQVSAKDCGLLLEQVYHRTLSSRRVCNEIETMMLNQDTRYKIPAGLPEGVEVGNKTGEMDTVENDIAIIYGEKSDYILCVLSGDWDSKNEAISHIAEISSVTYEFFDNQEYYDFAFEAEQSPGPIRADNIHHTGGSNHEIMGKDLEE